MVGTGGAWLFCVPCGADQHQEFVCVSASRHRSLAARASATQSEGWHNVGSCGATRGGISAYRANHSSLAACAFCRQSPKVEARCVNRARRDLCGGRSVMSVPTAIVKNTVAVGVSRMVLRPYF